jgi:hypothetical protein
MPVLQKKLTSASKTTVGNVYLFETRTFMKYPFPSLYSYDVIFIKVAATSKALMLIFCRIEPIMIASLVVATSDRGRRNPLKNGAVLNIAFLTAI